MMVNGKHVRASGTAIVPPGATVVLNMPWGMTEIVVKAGEGPRAQFQSVEGQHQIHLTGFSSPIPVLSQVILPADALSGTATDVTIMMEVVTYSLGALRLIYQVA